MLWITRTPLRVSLFGGGTDYPEYYERRPGAVVGFAIDKYIHIAALRLTAYQPYNVRLAYSILEHVEDAAQIQHPVVRVVLKHFDIRERLDLSIMSDLPASGSGLGSSSSFTVGLLKLVNCLRNHPMTKIDLARTAIMVERELLAENVGVQDQLHATFGGINRFDFEGRVIHPDLASADDDGVAASPGRAHGAGAYGGCPARHNGCHGATRTYPQQGDR